MKIDKEIEPDLKAGDVAKALQVHYKTALTLMRLMPGFYFASANSPRVPRWGLEKWRKDRAKAVGSI